MRIRFAANDVRSKVKNLAVPIYHLGGWFDPFLRNTIDHYKGAASSTANQRLIVGPWTHGGMTLGSAGGTALPDAAFDDFGYALAWPPHLALVISSTNFPKYDRHPNTYADLRKTTERDFVVATQTIQHSATFASAVHLPIIGIADHQQWIPNPMPYHGPVDGLPVARELSASE
jgi:predicted acyl esterase